MTPQDFIAKEFTSIIQDSREYRAYELGMAVGYFQLYCNIKQDQGEKIAKNIFEDFFNGTERFHEYFKKIVEIDNKNNENQSLGNIERFKEFMKSKED